MGWLLLFGGAFLIGWGSASVVSGLLGLLVAGILGFFWGILSLNTYLRNY